MMGTATYEVCLTVYTIGQHTEDNVTTCSQAWKKREPPVIYSDVFLFAQVYVWFKEMFAKISAAAVKLKFSANSMKSQILTQIILI